MSRKELLRQLSALDFMAVDLQLFLNTHPTDRLVLAKYNAIVEQADGLRQAYEKSYGPLYSFRSRSEYPWQWINNPWPWSNDFNFKLAGEEE